MMMVLQMQMVVTMTMAALVHLGADDNDNEVLCTQKLITEEGIIYASNWKWYMAVAFLWSNKCKFEHTNVRNSIKLWRQMIKDTFEDLGR